MKEVVTPLDGLKLTQVEKSKQIFTYVSCRGMRLYNQSSCMHSWEETEEVAALMVVPESIFITMDIEAHEERDASIMDLPGACLHAMNEDNVVTTMTEKLA